MLVISRKLGETVRLGPDIVVKVLRVRSGQIRLGIEAPDSVVIEHGGEPFQQSSPDAADPQTVAANKDDQSDA